MSTLTSASYLWARRPVTDSMMPEGVEHIPEARTFREIGDVTDSMMPEGVEHLQRPPPW